MNRISSRAVVETEAIGAGVTIAEFAVVRSGVTIGNRVVIHPHVVIESGAYGSSRIRNSSVSCTRSVALSKC